MLISKQKHYPETHMTYETDYTELQTIKQEKIPLHISRWLPLVSHLPQG